MSWWVRLDERRRAERRRERERERNNPTTPAQMMWFGLALLVVSAVYWAAIAAFAETGSISFASRAVFLFVILPVAGVVLLIAGAIGAMRARARR